jgi:hypothetical protein
MSAGISDSNPSFNWRWWIWLPLLGAAGWLILCGDKPGAGDREAVSMPVRQAPAAAPAPARAMLAAKPLEATPEPIEILIPRDQMFAAAPLEAASTKSGQDLFSTRNWNPPLPQAPIAVAAPVAPPLAFTFLGKKLEGEMWEVYLSRDEQTFIAREGQTLDGVYRVDKISPPTLALTYLPLGQPQTLMIGESR